ncbi:hypothetical protein HanRHA438_Chr16g0753121 [Helianthus annuus]|nr:hypothetical protein HanRHA438_Chr16g0753121 [Helianthus annuus]
MESTIPTTMKVNHIGSRRIPILVSSTSRTSQTFHLFGCCPSGNLIAALSNNLYWQ